jgi:Domain of unknown function (DUF4123)
MTAQAQSTNPALAAALFAKGETPVYAILDGASAPNLVKSLYEHEPEYCCLYRGELEPDMATVAPYLVRLEPESNFTELVLGEGWGAHWGSFVVSPATLRTLRDHFRAFHAVELPDQRTVLFRYYDPRVLRNFLPVCTAAELATFFGPVQQFLVEGETPESGIKFSLAGTALKPEPFQIKKA